MLSKLIRLFVVTLIICGLLVTGFLIWLRLWFDPNSLKPQITQTLSQKLKTEVKINGTLQWTRSINPTLILQQLVITNPPPFTGDLLHIPTIKIQVHVPALIKKQLVFNKISISSPQLKVQSNENGLTNLQQLIESMQTTSLDNLRLTPETAQSTTTRTVIYEPNNTTESSQSLDWLQVQSITINKGVIQWRPRAGVPVDIKEFMLKATATHALNLPDLIDFSAHMHYPASSTTPLPIQTRANIDYQSGEITAEQLSLRWQNIPIFFRQAKGNWQQKLLTYRLDIPFFDPKPLVKSQNVPIKFIPQQIQLTTKAQHTLDTMQLSELSLQFKPYGTLNAALNWHNPNKAIQTNIDMTEMSLQQLGGMIAGISKHFKETSQSTAEPSALNQYTLQAKINASKLELSPNILLDQFHTSVQSAKGITTFNPTQINWLNAVHHIAATINTQQATPQLSIKYKVNDLPLSAVWQTLQQQSRLDGATDLSIELKSKGKQKSEWIQNLNGEINTTTKHGYIYGVDIPDLLKQVATGLSAFSDFAGTDKPNIGNLLRAVPKDWLKLKDGSLIREHAKSPFERISSTSTISNGIVNNKSLSITHPEYVIFGTGQIDLPNQMLDYIVRMQAGRPLVNFSDQVNQILLSEPFAVKINGPFTKPHLQPEANHYAKILLKQVQKKTMNQFTQQIFKPGQDNDANNNPLKLFGKEIENILE